MSTETAETTDDAAEQPVPWIVQYQRARCTGSSPLATFQGVLCDQIMLPQSAADHSDPAQLVLATDAWVDALLNQAQFLPGEFAHEALWSYYVRDYLTQVRSGGHEQYFANRGGDEIAVKCASHGLKSMLADPHLDLLTLLLQLKRATPQSARKIAADAGYRSAKDALKDLDKRFEALETTEPLTSRQKTWLKSLRKVKFVPDAEMTGHLQRVAQSNALFPRRKMEAERVRAETLRASPAFRASKALADMAGARISNFRVLGSAPVRSVWPEGPDIYALVCRLETDKGTCGTMFYAEGRFTKRYLSVMVKDSGGLPLGSRELSKADYEEIVPKEG